VLQRGDEIKFDNGAEIRGGRHSARFAPLREMGGRKMRHWGERFRPCCLRNGGMFEDDEGKWGGKAICSACRVGNVQQDGVEGE